MTTTRIVQPPGISNTTYHRRCTGKQGFWWLRRGHDFVRIGEHRGDYDLDVELDLSPGEYTLGCGPRDKFGFRKTITVEDDSGKQWSSCPGRCGNEVLHGEEGAPYLCGECEPPGRDI